MASDSAPPRIAITGLRWNRLSRADVPFLRHQLAILLPRLGGESAVLLTGMAEGADTLAALACPPGWQIEAILPLPLGRWRQHLLAQIGVGAAEIADFDRIIGQVRLIELGQDGVPDFLGLAEYLATSCDALLALGDGLPGLPGGTADVIARARQRGVPVTIIPIVPTDLSSDSAGGP